MVASRNFLFAFLFSNFLKWTYYEQINFEGSLRCRRGIGGDASAPSMSDASLSRIATEFNGYGDVAPITLPTHHDGMMDDGPTAGLFPILPLFGFNRPLPPQMSPPQQLPLTPAQLED